MAAFGFREYLKLVSRKIWVSEKLPIIHIAMRKQIEKIRIFPTIQILREIDSSTYILQIV